jgi:hypothetical protein
VTGVAAAGSDHTVRVWDADAGKELLTLSMGRAGARAVAFDLGGRRLAATSGGPGRPGEVKVWDPDTGAELFSSADGSGFAAVAFSPDGRLLAAACGDHTVRVWHTAPWAPALTLRGHTDVVQGVAFAPDGRTLASAGADQVVRLWDLATGREARALRGHTTAVWGVTFSPDGQRLATAGQDQAVKIWDVVTGQEMLTLRTPSPLVNGVAFSRDGRRLAAVSRSTTVVWDARPLTPELGEEREAMAAADFLFAGGLPREEVLARLSRHPGLSGVVREKARAYAEAYARARRRREAEDRVADLFNTGRTRAEVLDRLRMNGAVAEPLRQEALAVAEQFVPNPDLLDRASRAVVRRPGAEPGAYERAGQQAEAACRLAPFEAAYQTTLGMARYRLRRYAGAVEALTEAQRLRAEDGKGPTPADLAFLAMAQHGLGQAEAARATLGRLREAVQQAHGGGGEEAREYLGEAEGVVKERPGSAAGRRGRTEQQVVGRVLQRRRRWTTQLLRGGSFRSTSSASSSSAAFRCGGRSFFRPFANRFPERLLG